MSRSPTTPSCPTAARPRSSAATGSVDWLCAPRFDSPVAVRPAARPRGRALVAAAAGRRTAESTRRYVDETMVLETTWTTATGTRDRHRRAGHRRRRGDPHALGANAPRLLVRALECTAGQVEVAVEFAPRPEYGLVEPLLAAVAGGVIDARAAPTCWRCPAPSRSTSTAAPPPARSPRARASTPPSG